MRDRFCWKAMFVHVFVGVELQMLSHKACVDPDLALWNINEVSASRRLHQGPIKINDFLGGRGFRQTGTEDRTEESVEGVGHVYLGGGLGGPNV